MSYYRITVYNAAGEKDVIVEDDDDDIIFDQTDDCLQDLFKGNIKSVVVSRITGKGGE